jgi:hypothetical protein
MVHGWFGRVRDARLAAQNARSVLTSARLAARAASRWRRLLYSAALLLSCVVPAGQVFADTITGTVKDPSGAVVTGARIEISGGGLAKAVTLISDEEGKFITTALAAGKYTVRVTKEGFDEISTTVELHGSADIPVNLTISAQQTSVTVTGKSQAYANSDSTYRQLRDIGLGETYHCENFVLPVDVGTFELKSGTLTMLRPVGTAYTGAVFVGQGHFSLKALARLDTGELLRRTGSATVEEDFSEVVFRFTPDQYAQFGPLMAAKVATPGEAGAAFQRWKDKVRHRHENPVGLTQGLFESESIDNVDADVMAAVYNPLHPFFFNAYIHGATRKDLRFFVRARVGALPQMDSPEEVALVNFDGDGMNDGIWYSQHLKTELTGGTANSQEDRRLFATRKYKIETVIGKNGHLLSRATITFEPLVAGERVLKFSLLPNLRVFRVVSENGQDLRFIQENRREDGSFYAILDEPAELKKTKSISVEYGGDKVLMSAGSGSYYVGARDSWYPNLNGFGEKSIYDLTFKVPPSNVLISVGKLDEQHSEAGYAVSHWTTPVPIAVAGFNYGQYKKLDLPDPITHYEIAGYYLQELPNMLQPYRDGALSGMAPQGMTKYALEQARAQMQVCTMYFGRAPYENVYITEQPNFNFGQSWPNLVYLPISAYIDSTQRWMLFGHISSSFTGFVQEVTPHEVAHQWFGHAVGWASYHDQWLSEGFAEFAAGLFLQQAMGPKWQKDYTEFWERNRKELLEKNSFGISPNDAGPLYLGLRLIAPRSPNAYQGVTYAKGAFVLSMLRSMMRSDDGKTANPDQAFIDMMHDFMASHKDTPASIESFMDVVDKHITKQMDLQQNGRLRWFFKEWVMGTQVPRYAFKYEVQPGDAGKTKIHMTITQSEVDDSFAMLVPVFADFGSGMARLGQIAMAGNSTRNVTFVIDKQPKKVALNVYKEVLER